MIHGHLTFSLNLVASEERMVLHKVTYSRDPEIRLWASWGPSLRLLHSPSVIHVVLL